MRKFKDKKKYRYDIAINNPIIDIDRKSKKGWRIGSLTLLCSKKYKNANRIKNFLLSEKKIKNLVFEKKWGK